MRARRAAILLLVGAAAAAAAPAELAPYRAVAASPAGARLLHAARAAMRGYFAGDAAAPADSMAWPGPPVGVYVSLAGPRGTRACVGSAVPLGDGLEATVRALAVQALAADRRRPAVRRDELDSLQVVISFAGPGQAIASPMAVDPAREGLLVSSPRGSVAFLPGEARTVSWALREARRAGVLGRGAEASYQRFAVVVLAEPAGAARVRLTEEAGNAIP